MAELLEPFAREGAAAAAQQLIDRFGSVQSTLAASPELLAAACAPDQNLASMIVGARRLVESALQEHVTRSPVRPEDPLLHRYLLMKLSLARHELLYAIYVDDEGQFIREDVVTTGQADRVQTRLRPLLRRAIELRAGGVLLAHNHPSHAPSPSAEDISATQHFARFAAAIDLVLVDHLIVAGHSVTSMRARGLL